MPCFHNLIWVGPGNQNFNANDGLGAQAVVLTAGSYTWDAFRNEFLARIQALGGATFAAVRMGISASGHVTIDTNGGANLSLTFTAGDTDIGKLLGFTTDLAGANSYLAPRRIRGAYYLSGATLREHDAKHSLTQVAQTIALSGVSRTTISGSKIDLAKFELQFLDNSARLVSPAGAVATTYANALATAVGLTEYDTAHSIWWDSTNVGYQGWNDGRPVRYFALSSDATIALSAAASTYTASLYTTWVFSEKNCKEWDAKKSRPPKTTSYSIDIEAQQYVAP